MAAASSVAPTGETLSEQTARTFCEVLDQRPCFHALSAIVSLSTIPLINQMGLDGSWVKLVGQGIQNHTFRGRIPASLVAGCTIVAALKIWAKTLEAPTADRAKQAANVAIREKLENAFLMCDKHAGDFSKVPLLKRFHQIMRAFDEKVNPDADETPVMENPPPNFSEPFKSMSDSAKPGETLGQRYVRSFSSLSWNGLRLPTLGLMCSAICYKIIPMMKLNGAWTKALTEKVQKLPGLQKWNGIETLTNVVKKTATEWHVAQRVGRIAAGYIAVVALKGLLSHMKAPNADKAAKAEAVKTLAQLSYAMHVVETRYQRNQLAQEFHGNELATKIVALPCSKAPLLKRFNNITQAYTREITKLANKKPTAAAPESAPVATDALFTPAELNAFVQQWIALPSAQKQAQYMNLSTTKRAQIGELLIGLTNPPPPPPSGSTGTSTTTTAGTTGTAATGATAAH